MSTTAITDAVCIPDERSLPDSPFTSLRYHFGMLLGVDDFSTEQRYHRGKHRLHNAWLHRDGIVWGLDVELVDDKREIAVEPGLALDPSGRELHLDVRCCMDIGAWYDENREEAQAEELNDVTVRFSGRVELAYCACGTRPVPAIAGPCEGAEVDTAYSRTYETVAIRFVPEPLEPPQPAPYPRLRLLFGLEAGVPADLEGRDDVIAARDEVIGLATADQPAKLLEHFRRFADLDTREMEPAVEPDENQRLSYPGTDDAGVVLANVRDITLERSASGWTVTGWTLDRAPRRAHVATHTIQELLCGAVRGGEEGGGTGETPPPAPADAGGPRVTSATIDRTAKTIELRVDKPLEKGTVDNEAFRVSRLSGNWEPLKVRSAKPSDDALTVTLVLRVDPGDSLVRFIARGTGQVPLLGADHVPLAGGPDSPPGTAADGHDYVQMFSS
jgi:hypothetical protein